jgi:glycosyltransferase involved in cell wall biosynthesis
MSPWLSVILPIHKGAAFLEATLAGAAAGDCSGIEFLFFDSGQDDGASRAIAMIYADRLDIIWTDAPETGPWTAKINRGVGAARASHIAMLHQDDLWLTGHHRALADTVEQMGDAALSIGPSRLVGSRGQDVGPWRMPFTPGRHRGRDVAATLIVQNTIAVPAPVFRRDTFLAVGAWMMRCGTPPTGTFI